MGAVGFAAGIERLLMAVEANSHKAPLTQKRDGLYLALTHASLIGEGFRTVQQLRASGVGTWIDFDGKSLKAQFREADKAGCRFVAFDVAAVVHEFGGDAVELGADVFLVLLGDDADALEVPLCMVRRHAQPSGMAIESRSTSRLAVSLLPCGLERCRKHSQLPAAPRIGLGISARTLQPFLTA